MASERPTREQVEAKRKQVHGYMASVACHGAADELADWCLALLDEHAKLTAESRSLAARWIDQGGVYLALKQHPDREYFHGYGMALQTCANQMLRELPQEG